MARPKKPEPLQTELTLALWSSVPDCLRRAREIGATEGAREIVTVLTNERPSRSCQGNLDYCLGWEACLKMLEQLLSGRGIETEDEEKIAVNPEIEAQLAWKD